MIRKSLKVLLALSVFIANTRGEGNLPILIWHSAGETCCGGEITSYANFIRQQMNGDVHIRSVSVETDGSSDKIKSLTLHPFEQIELVCGIIKSDPKFANGYNAVGLSQGGLLVRGLAQICPSPPMRNLISLGAPHQGVHLFPRCSAWFGPLCGTVQASINYLAYTWPLQKYVAPLTYWHDTDENRYKRGSTFLAVINNEKQFNTNFITNLQKLNRIVLVKYVDDHAIVPNESTWFGYYDKNGREYSMEDSEVFFKLGLRGLKESGKLLQLASPGDHLNLDEFWFSQNIIPFLR